MGKLTTRALALVFFCVGTPVLAADGSLFTAPPVYQPAPSEQLLTYSTSFMASVRPEASPDDILLQARELLEQSRATGSLRPVGRALTLMGNIPTEDRGHSYQLMLATLEQRLHHFDKARSLLRDILEEQPLHRQALLTFYSIALVQGDYVAAHKACQTFQQAGLGLMTQSCQHNLQGLQGKPEAAFRQLLTVAQQYKGNPRAIDYRWTLVTLAELAQSIAHPETEFFWKTALDHSPEDHYAAAEFSEWYIHQGRYREALTILDGQPDSDRIAVLKAMALMGSGSTQAEEMRRSLQQRFAETRASGDTTHLREYTQFLLEVEDKPQEALTYAELNWRHQKERADFRLLQKARLASNGGEP